MNSNLTQALKSIALILTLFFASCRSSDKASLPILGVPTISGEDTSYHTIRPFHFMNQDSIIVSNDDYHGKVRVVDFFFTSCPTICPTLTREMKRIYDEFANDNRVMLLSHTIDIKHDTIPALKEYAQKIDVSSSKWSFVTGQKEDVFDIAADYFSVAIDDSDAPGGFDHSGNLILVDDRDHVRSFCQGTDPKEVDRLMDDIRKLLREYEN